jgi:hypothetical protein
VERLNIPTSFVDIGVMTSPRQIDANRRNAQKSTGPRTGEGKRIVAQNAVKHGLLSQHVVLANEDESEFEDFTRRLRSALSPLGELEEMLVDSIAASAWRLRRVLRVERGLFVAYIAEGAPLGTAKADNDKLVGGTIVVQFGESEDVAKETARADEAERQARDAEERAAVAERLVEEADAISAAGDAEIGRAFMADAQTKDAFTRLSRYEAHIQRSMFKALEELRRLQAARH